VSWSDLRLAAPETCYEIYTLSSSTERLMDCADDKLTAIDYAMISQCVTLRDFAITSSHDCFPSSYLTANSDRLPADEKQAAEKFNEKLRPCLVTLSSLAQVLLYSDFT